MAFFEINDEWNAFEVGIERSESLLYCTKHQIDLIILFLCILDKHEMIYDNIPLIPSSYKRNQ